MSQSGFGNSATINQR
ncbi:hypothetical protein [uncultured Pseudomonas sp.]